MNLESMSELAQSTRRMTGVTGMPRAEGRASIEELRQRLERQSLLMQTLLMLLLEKKIIDEDEFRQWLAYVDDLDGVRDGKVRPDLSPRECPKCGRTSSRSAAKCIYCDEAFPMEYLDREPPTP